MWVPGICGPHGSDGNRQFVRIGNGQTTSLHDNLYLDVETTWEHRENMNVNQTGVGQITPRIRERW